jgi:predicted porin
MKKSLLALAVLGAFAGAASAQSSVTIYGMVDLALAKQIGSEDNQVWDSPDSRIGFRGSEDLGGGLKAIFQFEMRFNAANGENDRTDCSTDAELNTECSLRMWHAISMVGLSGNFGTVGLGRQYNGAWPVTNGIDPWGDDSVAGLRSVFLGDFDDMGMGSDPKRVNNSIRYDSPNIGGFTFAATIAESNGVDDRPYALSGVYSAGPLWLGLSYLNPTDENDDLITLGAKYKFGQFGIAGGYSFGTSPNDGDIDSWILAGTMQLGGGELRVGYTEYQEKNNSLISGNSFKLKKAGLGYYYSLSKRTRVYADIAMGSSSLALINADGVEDEDLGYGVGIRHSF